MKRAIIMLAVVGILAGSGSLYAQVEQGMTEMLVSGTYTNTDFENDGREESAVIGLGLGHFFTDHIQLGVTTGWAHGNDLDIYSLGGNAKYHFMTDKRIVPYAGAFLSWAYADADDGGGGSDCGYTWGPLGGVKFFVTDMAAIFAEYQWQVFESSIADNIDNQQVVLLGVSFFF